MHDLTTKYTREEMGGGGGGVHIIPPCSLFWRLIYSVVSFSHIVKLWIKYQKETKKCIIMLQAN
jgi:hypothetical protein